MKGIIVKLDLGKKVDLGYSLGCSLWGSFRKILGASFGASLRASFGARLSASLWGSLRDSLWFSLGERNSRET
jgi:hypothetical protein